MATTQAISAATYTELLRLLNGVISSKRNLVVGRDINPNPDLPPNNLFKHPVDGLTLEFTSPAATVTFSADLDYKEIVDEINTQAGAEIAHLVRGGSNGELTLSLWDDTTPVVLKESGTANAYFGFSTTAADPDLTQTPIAPANIIAIDVEVLSRKWVCFYHT